MSALLQSCSPSQALPCWTSPRPVRLACCIPMLSLHLAITLHQTPCLQGLVEAKCRHLTTWVHLNTGTVSMHLYIIM